MENIWNFIADIFSSSITLYIINALLIITVIFNERKSPSAILAWIMILTFVPVVGFIFYLVFNQNLSRSKINKMSEREEQAMSNALKKQMESMDRNTYEFRCESTEKWKHLLKLNQVYGKAYYTQDNEIELFTDGRGLFESLIDDIMAAKETINIEYYIVKRDKIGRRFLDALTKKAAEGVEVRLLMDALGSRYITKGVVKDFLKAGGKIGYFFKPKFIFIGLKLNYRNHRKIAVIDGKIAYTGGYNIAKEYVGEKKKFGYWRDTHVRIEGGAVYDLNQRFIMDWKYTTREKLEAPFSAFSGGCQGDKGVQIVSCGPEDPKEEVKRGFMRMITYAEKNVYVQTPYFVPDQSIVESLKMAAQSGIDVRIMIPCMPDHMFVYWATYSYLGDMVMAGANCYTYNNGFLHSKGMIVDDRVLCYGTANMDIRSFALNFEVNAVIYDEKKAWEMVEIFHRDLEVCRQITRDYYTGRNLKIRIKEQVCRLLSPLL